METATKRTKILDLNQETNETSSRPEPSVSLQNSKNINTDIESSTGRSSVLDKSLTKEATPVDPLAISPTDVMRSSDLKKHEVDQIIDMSVQSTDDIEYESVPPDGGWGWCILGGCMIVNILIPGTIKSFGVLITEFMEVCNASRTAVSWIPALCFFLYSILSPITSILCGKYSFRMVTVIGGTSAILGIFLSHWATSIGFLCLTYGVLLGIGAGLTFPATVYIVASYFVRRRGLANGICISGSAIGSIVLPPVLRWLLASYGYSKALLVMGILSLNVYIAALLYDPVAGHMKRVPKEKVETIVHPEPSQIFLPLNSQRKIEDTENITRMNDDEPSCSYTKKLEMKHDNSVQFLEDNVVATISRTQSNVPTQRNSTDLNVTIAKLQKSPSSLNYIATPFHGSVLSFQPKQLSHMLVETKDSSRVASAIELEKNQHIVATAIVDDQETKTKLIDFSILKNPMYIIIMICNCVNAIGYTNFIILLPGFGVAAGYDKIMAAYLLSIVSAADVTGRIGGSALSDLGLIPKTWYFIGGLIISGISLNFLPFMSSYAMHAICCACFGLAAGIYIGITPVLMADMLGQDRLSSSFGISLCFNGMLQLFGPPLCGYWLENNPIYSPIFHILGAIMLAGSTLWLLMPYFKERTK